jgi:hypothetical protein
MSIDPRDYEVHYHEPKTGKTNSGHNGDDHYGDPRPEPPPEPEPEPFATFDAGDWEGQEIEARRWAIKDRIPCGEPGIISGDGGSGKTLLGLQAAVAHAAERPDWLNAIVETHGPALVSSL